MWPSSQNFDNSNSGAGGFLNNTQSPAGDKKKAVRRPSSVFPLVVRQITSSSDKEFELYGFPVQFACIVGILKNFNVQSTKVACSVEDHTGEIKCILWLEQDDKATLPQVKEGHYVKIYGTVRQQDDEKMIMIVKILPVDDCNVITNHLLEAIHARLQAEAHSKEKNHVTSQADFGGMGDTTDFTRNELGLNVVQAKVHDILMAGGDADGGIGRVNILSKFGPNQTAQVNAALEFLIQEGHAYTTFDPEHFKATASM